MQGLAEWLPVSSSAYVVVAEKLVGLDPSSLEMTLLLVMLHTGTMLAVIVYFWKEWRNTYFRSQENLWSFLTRSACAMFLTFMVGCPVVKLIDQTMRHGRPRADIEELFSRLGPVAMALLAAGIFILFAGWYGGTRAGGSPATRGVAK